jgi:hypothetical protein
LTAKNAYAIEIASYIKTTEAKPDNETAGEGGGETGTFSRVVPRGPAFPAWPGRLLVGGVGGEREQRGPGVRGHRAAPGPGRRRSPLPRRRGARGFTHAQYLTALVSLHEAMRKRADGGDAEVAAALERLGLGLGTVAI